MPTIRDQLAPDELETWTRIWRRLLEPRDDQRNEPAPREETDDDN